MASKNYIMTRQFLPVGQGAFYMENFSKITISLL